MPETEGEDMLPLDEVIRELRNEITKAATAGQNEWIRFGLGAIDLEFQIVAKREGGPSGKIKFGIWGVGIEAGASVKWGSESTQKVKFTLKPMQIGNDGSETEQVLISRRRQPAAKSRQANPRPKRSASR